MWMTLYVIKNLPERNALLARYGGEDVRSRTWSSLYFNSSVLLLFSQKIFTLHFMFSFWYEQRTVNKHFCKYNNVIPVGTEKMKCCQRLSACLGEFPVDWHILFARQLIEHDISPVWTESTHRDFPGSGKQSEPTEGWSTGVDGNGCRREFVVFPSCPLLPLLPPSLIPLPPSPSPLSLPPSSPPLPPSALSSPLPLSAPVFPPSLSLWSGFHSWGHIFLYFCLFMLRVNQM